MKQYKVWYGKFWDINRKNQTEQEYVELKIIDAEDLEDVFYKMQGEVWSPNGEARNLIRSKGLTHTSMSVGDIIEDIEAQKFYMVDSFGFKDCEKIV